MPPLAQPVPRVPASVNDALLRHRPWWARRQVIGTGTVALAVTLLTGLATLLAAQPEQAKAGPVPAAPRPSFPVPTAGQTGSANCTDPVAGHEWRVSWQATSSPRGTMLSATGFARRDVPAQGAVGAWTGQDDQLWELRWTPPPTATGLSADQPGNQRRGSLAQLRGVQVEVARSPRLVAPDGSCSVYLAAFDNGEPRWPSVAVLGDSLVSQLHTAEDDALHGGGLIALRLLPQGRRTEVVAQPGRRWTRPPSEAGGLDQSDADLLDEIRGLRGASAQIVALGTNDAGWASLASNAEQYRARLDWVLLRTGQVLTELASSHQCTVLVTAGDRGEHYLSGDPGLYAGAAGQLDAQLRREVAAHPDTLHLLDWAELSADHHFGSADSWYGPDTVHLSERGRVIYADELAAAADDCLPALSAPSTLTP
jgi:lysophospholipase L1-like esterase